MTQTGNKITADSGKVFRRIHDGFTMGAEIVLGIDYSIGVARQDLPEYYEEIIEEVWHVENCQMRVVAPKALINFYPELLFQFAVKDKLPVYEQGENMLIYYNWIKPEHQAFIDASQGTIYIETNVG